MKTSIVRVYTVWGSSDPALVLRSVVAVDAHTTPGCIEFHRAPPVGPIERHVVSLSAIARFTVIETPEGT